MEFIQIYSPLLIAIALLIAAFKLKLKEMILFKLKLPFAELQVPISNILVGRALLVLFSLVSLGYYAIIDFSSFVPERLKMEVFYDEAGLRESLSSFTDKELRELGYSDKNFGLRHIYYEDLDKTLNKNLSYKEFFPLKQGITHSEGETRFKVEKESGFHNYYFSECTGELTHVLERPNAKTISFKSFFEKLSSNHDYLKPNLSDILKGQFIFQPRFKQIIAEQYRSNGVLFDHTLVGATKFYLFPLPKVERTVYFFEHGPGILVPVAYAVYKY